jgi:hypothetical protein
MLDWRKFYAHVTNPFGTKGPFYGPAGHHGTDFAAAPHQAIPTFIKAKCVLNGRSKVLGDYTVLKAGVTYYGWAHLLQGTRPDVGDVLQPGMAVGKAAGANDYHGSAWSGSHCHTTRSLFLTGIFDGRTLNPWTAIKKALAKK